ncbi:alcohol acetyltransferase [Dichomitus squalens]|uniref:Alcohol acetyltransferase n=1 Tax=Dichomitus squalens TaxID=114155 RepID=A0A4Q9N2T9_9APHY|nr:alcohol acetyltransferase [Dichomitus squalens]
MASNDKTADSKPPSPIRRAGPLEQYYNVASRIGIIQWVIVSARYEHPSLNIVSKPVLFTALGEVVRSLAALHARLPPPSEPPIWQRLPSVNLIRLVTWLDKDSNDMKAVFEDICVTPTDVPEDMPWWKLYVLRDGTVIFTYDHTIGDGQSGLAFHHALFHALNSLKDEDIPSEHSGLVTDLPQYLPLTPSLEEAAPRQLAIPFFMFIRVVLETYLPFLFSWDRKCVWSGNPIPTVITPEVNVRILRYSAEDATTLLKLSRERQATLTATLHTLALVALSRLISALPNGEGEKYQKIVTGCPISMRRYTGAPETAMCVHISHSEGPHDLLPASAGTDAKSFPWHVATRHTEFLREEVLRTGPTMGMLKFLLGRYEEYFRGRMGMKRASGLVISNLGTFNPKRSKGVEGAWTISDTLFLQGDAIVGAALKLNVTGSPEGGVGISITWRAGAVEQSFAEEFARGFKDGLQDLIRGQ